MAFIKDFSNSIEKITKTPIFRFVFIGLFVFVFVASAFLVYLNFSQGKQYPKLDSKAYHQVEDEFLKILDSAQADPYLAIEKMQAYPLLPKTLENRRKFILTKLYDSIGETVLAFIIANEIEEDYLPKHVAYFRVKLAEKVGHEAALMKDLEFLKSHYPSNQKYNYELAKSYLRQNQIEDARKIFQSLLKTKSEYAIASNYYLATLAEDKKEKANFLKEYLINSPNGSLGYFVSDAILAMDKADQAAFKPYSNYMALTYYKIGDYSKAIELFNTALDSPELYLRPFVNSLIKLDKKDDAAALILRSIPKITDPQLQHEMIAKYSKLSSDKDAALAQLEVLKGSVLTENKDKVQWEIAKITDTKEDYAYIYENHPESPFAAEALRRIFWKEYVRSNYHGAIDVYRDHQRQYESSKSHPFVAFWAAKIHFKLDEKDSARAVLQNLIISHPDDYYGFRASQILDKRKNWYLMNRPGEFIAPSEWSWPEVYKDFDIEKLFGADILELTKAGQYEYILSLAEANEVKIDNDFKIWLYVKIGNFLDALELAKDVLATEGKSIDSKNVKFYFAYPLAYQDLIVDETSKNLKVDPMLVQALIRQESSYRPNIVSPAGAVGLMQLMPFTARDVAKTLGETPPVGDEDLMIPGVNIKLGVKYLEEVLDKYDENLIWSIASYNAGPIAVNGWANKFKALPEEEQDMDLFIENIPYDETRNYTKKVLNNYWIYKQLYN